jgi:hypothetical protein
MFNLENVLYQANIRPAAVFFFASLDQKNCATPYRPLTAGSTRAKDEQKKNNCKSDYNFGILQNNLNLLPMRCKQSRNLMLVLPSTLSTKKLLYLTKRELSGDIVTRSESPKV